MIISYQEEQRSEMKKNKPILFAKIVAVRDDGLKLQFDGEQTPSQKYYKYNKSITFKVGDRVKVAKISGTYIVEYPIN
mgnify:FL=1